MMTIKELQLLAEQRRKRLVEVVYRANAGHIGGDLSCLNVLTALYFHVMRGLDPQHPKAPGRDRFVLSKGHCVEALYVTLEARGFLSSDVLDTLGQFGSILSGHPTIEVPGIEVNSGALGHGLSIGVGMALAAKMNIGAFQNSRTPALLHSYTPELLHSYTQELLHSYTPELLHSYTPTLQNSYTTYVLMGDGEQGEGSIYEAAMAANRYHLDNLVAIIDRNHLQISGNTEDVMPLDSINDRWTAFGWDVTTMNGDSMEDIVTTFEAIDYHNGKPHLLISNTTKGRGVSFMEGIAKWHHGVLNADQYQQAIAEIDARIAELSSSNSL